MVNQICITLAAIAFCCAVMAKTLDYEWAAVAAFGCAFMIQVCHERQTFSPSSRVEGET